MDIAKLTISNEERRTKNNFKMGNAKLRISNETRMTGIAIRLSWLIAN
jgi:hypothetical protein